jgi:hypothetical protein
MINTFWEDVVEKFKEGLLLVVKYGLLVFIIWYAFNFSLTTYNKAQNGEQAAILLVELQKKGYLPQLVNGQVPDKVVDKSSSPNTPNATGAK